MLCDIYISPGDVADNLHLSANEWLSIISRIMLRSDSVKGNMISGVSGEELEFLTMLTNSNTDAIFDQWHRLRILEVLRAA